MAWPLPFATSASSPALPTPSPVSLVGSQWVNIRAYFMELQMAEDESTRREVIDRLSTVSHALTTILDALLLERASMALSRPSSASRRRDHGSCSSALSESSRGSLPPTTPTRGTTTAAGLPPCHTFLWADAATSHVGRPPVTAEAEAEEVLAPIGSVFLVSLCQFAKHNEPPGSRGIILRFLARVWAEADLPRPALPGDAPRSLLQLFPGNTVVPLIDLMRRVGPALHPRLPARRVSLTPSGSSAGASNQTPTPLRTPASASQTSAPELEAGESGVAEYVAMLCALAERMEQVPALAAFFLPEATRPATSHTMEAEAEAEEKEKEKGVTHTLSMNVVGTDERDAPVSLVRELTAFLSLRDVTSGLTRRNEVCRLALNGLLSLAKCPDPAVQDFLTRESAAVAAATLAGARTTLLTLCKVPGNDDGVAQFVYICDVLRFWSQLLLTAPVLAERWGVRRMMEEDFVRGAIVRLLSGHDDGVYAAAALATAQTLRTVGCGCGVYATAAARAVLAPSMFENCIIPRLCASMAVHGGGGARIIGATLQLLDAVAVHAPALFQRHALRLPMRTLTQLTCYGNLSAMATSPPLNVSVCFSTRLRPPRGVLLGTQTEDMAEDILARLLLIESHVPSGLLEMRQRVINTACRGETEKAPITTTEEGVDRDGRNEKARQDKEDAHTEVAEGKCTNRRNIWFHQGLHDAPLIEFLCELTSRMLMLPADVCALLTGLWSTICILPDLRALYTLMDPDRGRLYTTLCTLRDAVDEELRRDEEVAFAIASAAAAVAGDIKKGGRSTTEMPPAPLDGRPEMAVQSAASHLYTRSFLYSRFIQLGVSLAWLSDVRGDEFTNKELLTALQKNRVFLEACTCIEAFRMELDAAVGHVVLSHNLMSLQTGKESNESEPGGSKDH